MGPWTVTEKADYNKKGRLERQCTQCDYRQTYQMKASTGLSYKEEDGKLLVNGLGECKESFLYISGKTPDGKTVDGIGYDAFLDNATIRYLVIEEGVSMIHPYAFTGCTSLISATLPENVSLFDTGAFMACPALVSVTLPLNIKSIPDHCFDSCTSLKAITLPAGITEIGNGAFNLCSSLVSVNLPENLRIIHISAFADCVSLEEVLFPLSLEEIQDEAFAHCIKLEKLTLPSHLMHLKEWAFMSCTALKKVYLPGSIVTISASNGCSPFFQCSKDLVLYTDAPSKPEGWSEYFSVFYPDNATEKHLYLKVIYSVEEVQFDEQ